MQHDIITAHFGSAPYRAMIALRHRVLRAPLGLAYTEEQLAAEHDQIHLALRHEGRVIGTLLLVTPDPEGTAKLRQMAVDPDFERRGFGRALVRHGEDVLAGLGAREIVLAARQSAIPFYQKLGYLLEGEPFTEVTIPHRRMAKRL